MDCFEQSWFRECKRNQNTKYVNQNTKGANQNIITKKICYFFFLILILAFCCEVNLRIFCALFRTNIRYGSDDVQSVCGRVQLPNSLLILWLLLPELILFSQKKRQQDQLLSVTRWLTWWRTSTLTPGNLSRRRTMQLWNNVMDILDIAGSLSGVMKAFLLLRRMF